MNLIDLMTNNNIIVVTSIYTISILYRYLQFFLYNKKYRYKSGILYTGFNPCFVFSLIPVHAF